MSDGDNMTASASSLSDAAFVDEVRRFLSSALTPDLREAGRNTIGVHSDIAACRVWHRRLFERGWIAPGWPAEYGGTHWTPAQRMLFERECADNDAPVLFAGGVRTIGPLLIAMGSSAQKARYLPAILNGSDLWCQGFSEPSAGSDLAALQMGAVREDDHYVVNGSKIWTTGAHIANRMFCLVRTERGARQHDGITFILVDMASAGLSVRPILSIADEHEFSEVFFDDVRVPVANRIAGENEGWAAAKLLMRFARSNNTTSGLLRRALRRAFHMLSVHGLAQSPPHRILLSELECDLRTFEALELRILSAPPAATITGAQASMMKTIATELHQRITTATLDIAAPAANNRGDALSPWLHEGQFAAAKYLATRAASIYSGTNETHRNQIAREIGVG